MIKIRFQLFRSYHFVVLLFCLALLLNSYSFPSLALAGPDQYPVLPDINTILMRSTLKIMGENGTVGTVFILAKPNPGEKNPGYFKFVLITAAHVMEDIDSDFAVIFFRKKVGGKYIKSPYLFQIRQNGKPLWVKHPDTDVAAMYIIIPYGFDVFDVPLAPIEILSSDKLIEDFELYPGREIKVIGFPLNAESETAGFPILRTGTIASFPLIPEKELKTFLIDFRVFDGNSGGPVYYYNPDWRKRGLALISGVPKEVHIILGLVSKQVLIPITTRSYRQETRQEFPLSIAEVVNGTFIRETISMLPPMPNKDTEIVPIRPMTFLENVTGRLTEKLPKNDFEKLKSTKAMWETSPTAENWASASDEVTFSAEKFNIMSTLTIASLPRNGAVIKFQTVGQRRRNEVPKTAKLLSTCEETVPIGIYHIWAERDGKTTSDINCIYEVVKSEEKVEISENALSDQHK